MLSDQSLKYRLKEQNKLVVISNPNSFVPSYALNPDQPTVYQVVKSKIIVLSNYILEKRVKLRQSKF
jgi:hypothetical protein